MKHLLLGFMFGVCIILASFSAGVVLRVASGKAAIPEAFQHREKP